MSTGYAKLSELPWWDLEAIQTNYADAWNAREKNYRGYCENHGWQLFDLKKKTCLLCAPKPGRPVKDDARANARREGLHEYTGVCAKHGSVPFSVAHAKCLTCFTTSGSRRVTAAVGRSETPRAIARRAGEKVYLDWCEEHGGPAEFDVLRGKCLVCYNAMGYRRPGATSP